MSGSAGAPDGEVLVPPPDVQLPEILPAKPQKTQQYASWGFLVIGLSLTIVIAAIGARADTISVTTVIALTVCSGLFQVLGVYVGNRAGRLDPSHVRTLARRLLTLQYRTAAATALAEHVFENAKPAERATLGRLSTDLSYINDHLIESVETWRDLRPDLFSREERNG